MSILGFIGLLVAGLVGVIIFTLLFFVFIDEAFMGEDSVRNQMKRGDKLY